MGELAALGTSICWSFTSMQFTLAGRRVGATAVNRVRLLLAVIYLTALHWVLTGSLWPVGATLSQWGWLSLSAVVGLVLGDSSLFKAFVLIGPRRSMLMMTLAPVIGAAIAWVWLGETLALAEMGAILATIVGIGWVVSEMRSSGETGSTVPSAGSLAGVLFGLGGATGQAVGLVFAKRGLMGSFDPLSGTLIRMLVGMIVIWSVGAVTGRLGAAAEAMRDRRTMAYMAGGALTGPTLGVWLSLVAVQLAPIGVASTLMALPPVFLIPLGRWILGEQVTPRAVMGTLVALAGATGLFLL